MFLHSLFLKVSWIRKRDLHILTVGILTYTNDQRFQSLHTEGSDEWTLKISSPQPRDSGTYECQVSTEPKISQAFRLNVVGKLTMTFSGILVFYTLTRPASVCCPFVFRNSKPIPTENRQKIHGRIVRDILS